MGKILWLVGGAVLAMAAFAVLNAPEPVYSETGGEDAAAKIGGWGTKQRAFGTGGQLKGKLEQGIGDLTGSENLSNQGAFDQAAGTVRDSAGKVAHAVEGAVRDITS